MNTSSVQSAGEAAPTPIRIFVLSPVFSPEVGGIETHLDDLCKILTAAGTYRCTVATFQPIFTLKRNDLPAVETVGCFTVHRFKWFGLGLFDRLARRSTLLAELYLAPYYLLRAALLFLRHRHQTDIIHAHGLMSALVGRLLKLISGKPLLVSGHAIYHLDRRSITNTVIRWVFKSVDRSLCTSEHSRDDFIQAGHQPARIAIYRFWIDSECFRPADKRICRSLLDLPDRFTVLYSGRFIDVKGIAVILDTVPRLSPDITIAFVGGGPMQPDIEAAARRYPNIVLIPIQANDRMYQVYAAADILLVPSLWQEGFARVIPEAMLCGTPVIAARRGGMQEILPPEAGRIIEPTAQGELAAAILALHSNPKELAAMGQAARLWAMSHHSPKNAEPILAAYRELNDQR